MPTELEQIESELKALITEARATKRWLHCQYQDMWFSPSQLEAANRDGRFRWGAVNWTLRDPKERLAEAERRATAANTEVERIAREIS